MTRWRRALLPVAITACYLPAQTWLIRPSGVTASLRGLSVVNDRVAWTSGTGGTYLETTDGATWRAARMPGAEALDFRDVYAYDDRTTYLLASGPGDKSRVYKTTDSGSHWTLQLTNPDPKGFFDAIAFWGRERGILLGDPVDGRFVILTTTDGGEHWLRQSGPPALPNEGAFAASGTCLTTNGRNEAWFGSGGPGGARVFHSQDGGRTWTVTETPLRKDSASAGIFSLAFSDRRHGIAVGGDYNKPFESQHNIAITSDGGRTWIEPAGPHPNGYRSAVAFLPDKKIWIAVGTTGSDISHDNGNNWELFDRGPFNAVAFAFSRSGFAVGPNGRLAKFDMSPRHNASVTGSEPDLRLPVRK